jgi:hypothetical protein
MGFFGQASLKRKFSYKRTFTVLRMARGVYDSWNFEQI